MRAGALQHGRPRGRRACPATSFQLSVDAAPGPALHPSRSGSVTGRPIRIECSIAERRLQRRARVLRRRQRAGPAGRQMIEPGARLVGDRSPELAERPVARRAALQEHHVDHVVRQIDVRDAGLGVHQLVGVVVVEDDHAAGADQLDPRRMAERRIFLRQRVAHPEIDHRAVVVGEHRVAHVRHVVVAGRLQHADLAARVNLDQGAAFEQPVHQVDVVGERVDHRRRVRIALRASPAPASAS